MRPICAEPDDRDPVDSDEPPPAAGGGEHPHHARGGRGRREAGDALLDRQGQRGDAAPGEEGVPSREAALPAPPRRHDLEVPGHVQAARPDGEGARARAARAHQPGRAGDEHQPVRPRLGRPHRRDEDGGAEAGAGRRRLRRGLRGRAT